MQDEIDELVRENKSLLTKNEELREQVRNLQNKLVTQSVLIDNERDNSKMRQRVVNELEDKVRMLETDYELANSKIRERNDEVDSLSTRYHQVLEDLAYAHNELDIIKETEVIEEQPPPGVKFEQSDTVEMIDSLIDSLSNCLQSYTSTYKLK